MKNVLFNWALRGTPPPPPVVDDNADDGWRLWLNANAPDDPRVQGLMVAIAKAETALSHVDEVAAKNKLEIREAQTAMRQALRRYEA